MDPLTGLEDIDWTLVDHAYGEATDVPGLLRRLATPHLPDSDLRSVMWTFYGNIYHQGTRYPATVATVPFLLNILDSSTSIAVREQLIQLLVRLAICDPMWLLPHNFDVEGERRRAEEMQTPEYEERMLQENTAWISKAETETEQKRRKKETLKSIQGQLHEVLVDIQVHAAVKDGLPVFYRCLDSPQPALRAHAAYALAWFPEEADGISAKLMAFLESEPLPPARATALLSLGVLQAPPERTPRSPDSQQKISGSVISKFLREQFERDDIDDLCRFCCALGLTFSSVAQDKHLEELLKKIKATKYLSEYGTEEDGEDTNDKTTNLFPFGTIDMITQRALTTMKGSAYPSVPLALAALLPSAAGFNDILTLTTAALTTAFDGERWAKDTLPAFDELTEPQQAVVRALTQVYSSHWSFANFTMELRGWGLPSTLKELQIYAS